MTKESGFVIINHVVKTTQKFIAFEPLAQAAEHLPFKQGVPGSIPGWLTKVLRLNSGTFFYLCFDKYRIALTEAVFAVSEKILRQNLTSGQI